MSGIVSPSGVSGGSSCEAEVGDKGPWVDVRRNEVLRSLDCKESEGWRPCGTRVLTRVSLSSAAICVGEVVSGDWCGSDSPWAGEGAPAAALMASLNAASSGSVSA